MEKELRRGLHPKKDMPIQPRLYVRGSNIPPHRIWPLIRNRVQPAELFFDQYSKGDFDAYLKLALRELKFQNAHMYTSKAFRRGATQELLQTGETLEVIKGSGTWVGNGSRSYIDLEFDKTLRVSQTIIKLDRDSSMGRIPIVKRSLEKGQGSLGRNSRKRVAAHRKSLVSHQYQKPQKINRLHWVY